MLEGTRTIPIAFGALRNHGVGQQGEVALGAVDRLADRVILVVEEMKGFADQLGAEATPHIVQQAHLADRSAGHVLGAACSTIPIGAPS